jgi:hypothetical protein
MEGYRFEIHRKTLNDGMAGGGGRRPSGVKMSREREMMV